MKLKASLLSSVSQIKFQFSFYLKIKFEVSKNVNIYNHGLKLI